MIAASAGFESELVTMHMVTDEVVFILLHYICSYSSISNFTLNLLEDSGWYKVDYAVAKSLHDYELLWGKGELISGMQVT